MYQLRSRAWLLVALAACDGGNTPGQVDAPVTTDAPAIDASPDAPSCVPLACDGMVDRCDTLDDGCGGTLECGACDAPLACGARAPNVCGIAEAQRFCTNGWCWENPLPFGMDLTSVWGAAPNDLWATGHGGTLLRYNGTTWRTVASGTPEDIHVVWGTAANNLYLGGRNGYLRRWNGTMLAPPIGAPTDLYIADIHGTDANDVWIAGSFGTQQSYRYNGVTWTGYDDPEFFGLETVRAFGATNAVGFGFSETAVQWNGVVWSEITAANAPQTAYDSWATGPSDLWVARRGGVQRWNGTAWSESLPANGEMYAIDGTSSTDIWAGGESGLHRWNGTAWQSFTTDAPVNGIWANTTTRAWAVGSAGRTLSWDGTAWTKHTGFGPTLGHESIVQISDTELWFIGGGAVRYKDGVVENHGALADIIWYHRSDSWAANANDIWVAGPSGTFAHWQGSAWTTRQIQELALIDLNGIWGASANDIYAVSDATNPFDPSPAYVMHYDGSQWTVATTITKGGEFAVDLYAVGGTASNDVWVGGDDSTLYQWNGATWTDRSVANGPDFYAFWTSSSGTMWAATSMGAYRRTGTTFVKVAGLDDAIGHITGTTDTDVWVTIGNLLNPTPIVARYNGTGWTRENTGAGQPVRELAVTPSTIWVAGRSGGILRKSR